MNKIEKLIKSHEIISFDIFDTLLIRPYINPYDVLKHIEEYTQEKGFAENRYKAECKARRLSIKEDITFDEIYKNVDQKFKYLKETELKFEETLLKVNPEIFEIYLMAKKLNKKIFIVSDMYLPKEFLEKVLRKNGYDYWDEFYLSSDEGVAKYTGNLFDKILKDKNLNPSKILHIGDSKISDVNQPKKLGLHAYHIEKNSDKFFNDKLNKKYKKIYKDCSNSLEVSLILSLLVEKYIRDKNNFKNKYWQSFGYSIAGPIGYGFVKFILNQVSVNKYNELLFVARDGYILKEIFELLKTSDVKSFYVYAQRILRARILLDYGDMHNADLLLAVLSEKIDVPESFKTVEDKKMFIEKNICILKDDATKKQTEYINYLKNLGVDFNENIAIIDTGAATFSAQQILEKVLDKKITGIYSIITKPDYAIEKDIRYATWAKIPDDIKSITNLIEFCFTSPERPIVDLIDGKPIYIEKVSSREVLRNSIYPEISVGIIDFIQDLKERLNGLDICFSEIEINNFIESFCKNLASIDKKYLKRIFCSSNASHTKYEENLLDRITKSVKNQNNILKKIFYIKKHSLNNKKRLHITFLGIKIKIKIYS